MVNKFLVGVGLVALVAVGSIGVWKLADGGDRRVGALGPIDRPMELAWRGTWVDDAEYGVGQVVSYEGASYVAEAQNAGQAPDAREGPWALMAAKGLQGAAGTFSGTLRSPNGKYSLVVADTGIVLQGDGARELIKLTSTGVEIETGQTIIVKAANELKLDSGAATRVKSGGTMTVEGTAATAVKGAVIHLNCSSGGKPVARQGDPVQVNPQGGNGPIIQGSPTVLAC